MCIYIYIRVILGLHSAILGIFWGYIGINIGVILGYIRVISGLHREL